MAKPSTKEKLIALFEQNKGEYFSGEELANRLGVSRTAVWKAVNGLRAEGYELDGTSNRGYCLALDTDVLSAAGIEHYLGESSKDFRLTVLPVTESTNSLLKDMAASGAPEGAAVVAAAQTSGRGRAGRSFYSPSDTGIYLSILLRPEFCEASRAANITTMAAVAVCEAIEDVAGREASIKWVNDIFMEGKKVCGILTEAAFNLESGYLDYAVLGIGINAYDPKEGFPEDIAGIAGAVLPSRLQDGKNRLVAQVLERFMSYYRATDATTYVKKYQDRCFVVGKQVKVITPTSTRKAKALAVDDDCHLLVEYPDGTRETLSSGEISVKPV